MDEKMKSKIDALLEDKKAKEEKAKKIREERETKEQTFLREFLEARRDIAKPALEEIKQYLEEKGLGANIDEQEEDNSQQGRKLASITIRFTMNYQGHRPSHDYPHLSIAADTSKQKVRFHESTIGPGHGGHGGPAGEYPLDELDKELIHEKVMRVLNEIIK